MAGLDKPPVWRWVKGMLRNNGATGLIGGAHCSGCGCRMVDGVHVKEKRLALCYACVDELYRMCCKRRSISSTLPSK